MEAERLEQIERLFHAALAVEKDRRADFLRESCGSDEDLRHEVESLLAYRSEAESFIEAPAMEWAAQGLAQDKDPRMPMTETAAPKPERGLKAAPWLPAHIGRYRIRGVLGEGGMGVVYEAEQEQPRRAVALKVIKPGLASPALLRRFEQESQALARLQHPDIAQIYEAGTADTGFGPQPYFAMELIRGQSLREYAQEHHLNTGQRLQLMVRICEGVHHAHQRGLIHRDLKPGNILVDETGQPKILDFGVARVTDRLTGHSETTLPTSRVSSRARVEIRSTVR
jgi:predicted Ser/Thr protein kinase